jgi:hypothetical protein
MAFLRCLCADLYTVARNILSSRRCQLIKERLTSSKDLLGSTKWFGSRQESMWLEEWNTAVTIQSDEQVD